MLNIILALVHQQAMIIHDRWIRVSIFFVSLGQTRQVEGPSCSIWYCGSHSFLVRGDLWIEQCRCMGTACSPPLASQADGCWAAVA